MRRPLSLFFGVLALVTAPVLALFAWPVLVLFGVLAMGCFVAETYSSRFRP